MRHRIANPFNGGSNPSSSSKMESWRRWSARLPEEQKVSVRYREIPPKGMRLWSSWLGFCTVTAEIAGSSPVSRAKYVPVAQLVEHWIEDPGVGGSNPFGYTK